MEETREVRRRRRWRRALVALLVIVLLVAGALGGAALWLASDAGQRVVREQVLAAVAGALAGRVDAGAVEVDASGHVVLRDLKLFTPEGELVAELARLEADVELLALRQQVLRLSSVTVERPRLTLAQDERGWNLLRAVAAKGPSVASVAAGSPTAWRVEVRGLDLVEGFFELQQEARRVTLTALTAKGDARVRLSPLEIDGDLELSSRVTSPLDEALTASLKASAARGPLGFDVAARLGGTSVRANMEFPAMAVRLDALVAGPREVAAFVPGWPLVVPVSAQGEASPSRLALSLRAGKAVGTVAATLDLPASKVPSFSLELAEVDLAELVGAERSSRLAAKATGRLDDLRPETLVGAAEATATWDAEGQRLADADFAVTAAAGTLTFSRLLVGTPGATLATRGTASLEQLDLAGALAATDLARVSQTLRTYANIDTAGLAGRGTLALTVTGPTLHPAAKAVGTLRGFAVAGVEADSIHVDADVPDVTRPLNTDTTLRAKRLRVGGRTFEEVMLDFYTFGRKLDLDLTTKGLGDLQVHVIGTLDRESTGASLESAEVTAAGARWELEGPGHVTWGERFELAPLVLREGARRISARAVVARGRIDAEVSLVALDLARLPRAFAPPALELAGVLTGTVTVKGKLASPAVEAKAALREGQVAGITGVSLDLDARWQDARAQGTVALASSVGQLDGTFDVPVEALLEGKAAPASAALTVRDVSLAALEPHLRRKLPVAGTLGATVALSGSAEAPAVRVVLEAPELDVDLDAEPGAPAPRPPPPTGRLGGRAKQGTLDAGAPRGVAATAPEEPEPRRRRHRVVRLNRPKVVLFTTEANTLSAELSASALGGVAIVGLATPLTLKGLRAQLPTTDDALALPVTLTLDVQGVDLHAAREARLHHDDELVGLVSLEGALTGSARAPRGTLTLGLKRAAVPPLRALEGALTLRLDDGAVGLDGAVSVQGKPALTLAARLGLAIDALLAAALAPKGDPLAVAGAAPFTASVTLREAPLAELLPPAPDESPRGGTASATLEVKGSLEAPELRLLGAVQGLRFDKVPLGSARFDVRSTPRAQQLALTLGGQGRDDLKVKGSLGLDLRLSSLRAGLDWRAAPVDLGLAATSFDLGFLSGAHELVRVVAGRLDLNGEVTGTLGAPRFEGDAVLAKGRVALAGLGDYRDINLELHASNDRLELSRLSLRSGAGEAQVQVKAERQPAGSFRVTGSAKTERFPVVNDDQLLANVSLTMELQGEATDALLNVTRLALPRVEVALPEVKRKDLQDLQRPKDIIVLRAGQRPSRRRREEAKAAAAAAGEEPYVVRAIVDAPRNIWVRSSDVNIELGLSEGFRLEYHDALQLFGEATLLRGTIEVIGREFSILKGSQLRFAGVATQPYVNVSALHVNDREQVKITVAVVGRGSDVSIKPSSEPAMPESDIYTVLATGRRQLQRGTGASLSTGQALSVIGQYVTSKAKTVLAKSLPIDVINFETSDDLQRFKVDVGKYLSDNLYLGASANIGADRNRGENVFAGRLEYQMTRTLSLEAYAGDALSFGVDAVWSHDF